MGWKGTGLAAGALATVPMTLVVVTARRLGLFRTPPPEQIAKTAADDVGLGDVADEPAFGPIWLALHLGFGAVCGLGYQQLQLRVGLPKPLLAGGAVYGVFVWVVNYLGLMPLLGLFPRPRQAGARRTGVMIVAHVVYGVGVAFFTSAGRGARRS
jgi:hypothetical protein